MTTWKRLGSVVQAVLWPYSRVRPYSIRLIVGSLVFQETLRRSYLWSRTLMSEIAGATGPVAAGTGVPVTAVGVLKGTTGVPVTAVGVLRGTGVLLRPQLGLARSMVVTVTRSTISWPAFISPSSYLSHFRPCK